MPTDAPPAPSDAKPAAEAGTPPRSPREWFELLYNELRRRARGELFRHQALTIGATTLLHEAWLRMDGRPLEFATQGELIMYASRVMRGILIDHIRSGQAVRHGGALRRVAYESLPDLGAMDDDEVLGLDEALEALAKTDARLAEVVELRFFAGMTLSEIAALRGVSVRTVHRDWDKARMILFASLKS